MTPPTPAPPPPDLMERDPSEIPYGEPCPICGPKGHAEHADDSYGGCVTCVEEIPHTDQEYRRVPFPCPASEVIGWQQQAVEASVRAERAEGNAARLADRLALLDLLSDTEASRDE